MEFIIIVTVVIILLFAGVVAFGAPYLPTLSRRVDDAIDLLDLKPGQTMIELGCGDGRLLKAAAKKNITGIGYELNPILVLYAKLSTWKYRKIVKIYWGNYWNKQWPEADGMYVFLLQPYMSKLHKKLVLYSSGSSLRLVSFGFKITEKEVSEEQNGMFLYVYK